MDPKRLITISRRGQRIMRELGVAHVWTPDEAKAAGRKGGLQTVANRTTRKDK